MGSTHPPEGLRTAPTGSISSGTTEVVRREWFHGVRENPDDQEVDHMSLSKPLQVVSFKMPPEDVRRLKVLAGEEMLTFSAVIRRGLELYVEDVAPKPPPRVRT
jgi:hypothetical protein